MYGEGKTRGSVSILGIQAATNQACAVVQVIQCAPKYVKACYEQSYDSLRRRSKGGLQPNLNMGIIKAFLIPVPPLAEQHRIVAALDEYLGLVDSVEADEAALEELAAKARAKVLDLAIRGKLVEQDPADEPASELLARVHAEKLAMVERGELKPKDVAGDSVIWRGEDNSYYEKIDGSDTVCIDDELPHPLPDGWCWTRLTAPFMFNPKNDANDDDNCSFAPMTAIDGGYASHVNYEDRLWSDVKKGFTHFADGDIAFAKISPCFENRKSFCAAGLANGIGAGTTELFVLRPLRISLDPKYVLLYLKSGMFIEKAAQSFKGTVGQQRVKSDYVRSALLPVPPSGEQLRIVQAVEEHLSALDFQLG